MTRLAIIDYGSGNVRSVQRALEAAANHHEIRLDVVLTDDPDRIRQADRIVLPGVGHFADCAAGLADRQGVTEALNETVFRSRRPFLGICVGMQLMADIGREDGETRGLGWIPGAVEKITPSYPLLPVPHMGWNVLTDVRPHALFNGFKPDPHMYFVHSYALKAEMRDHIAARCDYGGKFVAAVARDNLFGAQFHPEKSQQAGQLLLANFLRWKP
ncbi:MAG: imidazole glycerol phosphate synthase subunit HisH [Rhodobacterales bacterium 12-64-8]|nr:MAG: imidazole glycerol phosphate synthase subunit HisH [Rhodobacterales bacterium 12-64-8]